MELFSPDAVATGFHDMTARMIAMGSTREISIALPK